MTRSASMRPRGVAFAVESFANLQVNNQEIFSRMERVTLAKLDDFNNHYLIKVLRSFYLMGMGSNDLYDQLINKVLSEI